LAALIAFGAGSNAAAEQKPLWELGLGAAVLNGPDYRGAQGRSTFVLPLPYVVYRGKFLRAEDNTLRGLLHKSDWLEINFSVGGATPVKSNSTDSRQGMPDLDPALEIGPSANYTLAGSEHGPWQMQLRLPLRAVISGNSSSIDYRGLVLNPNVSFDTREWPGHGWRLGMSIGPMFGDAKNHRYYYEVKAKYATPERPEYDADGGYAGMRANMAISNRVGDVWLGGYVRYDNVAGAVFDGSPLVGRQNGVSAGVAFALIFKKSTRMIEE
jgi:outer membrane scaffolding protein for murein synthesis (MipA/OmpV family)